eukprot:CAMPEP_0182557842 /NCGR_PEP_ID=MMETSP1324-20130603/1626_1 /TAXON_ID=236786 /ORGANISM="Florenciella sp., Strain RCC1587" /LENGTH=178 /DNA_ID=CAMNT_0024769969 /DNA_START=24 /DNA_END=560 /DNA_ORIENTATION=+
MAPSDASPPNPGLARRITRGMAAAAATGPAELARRVTRAAGQAATEAVDSSELTALQKVGTLDAKYRSEAERIAAMTKFDLTTAVVAVPFAAFAFSVYRGWTTTALTIVHKRLGLPGLFALPIFTLTAEKILYDTTLAFEGVDINAMAAEQNRTGNNQFPHGGAGMPSLSLIAVRKRD